MIVQEKATDKCNNLKCWQYESYLPFATREVGNETPCRQINNSRLQGHGYIFVADVNETDIGTGWIRTQFHAAEQGGDDCTMKHGEKSGIDSS